MKHNFTIAQSETEWTEIAVQTIIEQGTQALMRRGFYTLVLSGGGTPQPIYQALASSTGQNKLDWRNTWIFWGDERCVLPTHQDSNYLMAKNAFLEHIPIPADNIFRIHGELRPDAAAQMYEEEINQFFYGREKRFDTTLLGLGNDGHTASLFPDTEGLKVTECWVVSNINPHTQSDRVTLTFKAINQSRNIIFLVKGADKSEIVAEIIENPHTPPFYPAKKITGKETLPYWIIDTAAAKHLKPQDKP